MEGHIWLGFSPSCFMNPANNKLGLQNAQKDREHKMRNSMCFLGIYQSQYGTPNIAPDSLETSHTHPKVL